MTVTVNRTGWSVTEEQKINTVNQYSLETVVSRLVPEEVETEAKNIRLERVLFAEDDKSPIYQRAMRLVPEEEWKAKQKRYKKPPYLIMTFTKKDGYEDEIKALLNQDLFLKESVDLREYFSPIKEPQEGMTCTAHAGKALMEYFQNRASKNVNSKLSWRFLYKVTRDLMYLDQEKPLSDGGATLRDTLRAMVLFGVPPEKSDKNWLVTKEEQKNWLATEERTDNLTGGKQPSAFAYAYAQNFQASKYFRLDKLREIYNQELLTIEKKKENEIEIGQLTVAQIRIALASGFPAIFGISDTSIFTKYINQDELKKIETVNTTKKRKLGQIIVPPLSLQNTQSQMGHALVAVGYDDYLEFDNPDDSKPPLKGGFLFRDSQGDGWGDKGYGWMPYEYVEKGLATDWWSLLNAEWINTSGFGIGTNEILGGCSCCGQSTCHCKNQCPSN